MREVMMEGWDRMKFRRTLHGELLTQWEEMKNMLGEVATNEEHDRLVWRLNEKNRFVVRDLYLFFKSSPLAGFRGIWKLKTPLKIKIFLWLMIKKSILTKDNLIKRGWTKNEECHFCSGKESIDHLMF